MEEKSSMARLVALLSKTKKKLKSLAENLVTDVNEAIQDENSVEKSESKPEVQFTSPTNIKVSVLSDEQGKLTVADLEKALKEVLAAAKSSKEEDSTRHILVADEPQWFYSPINRQMIRVHPGTELVLSDPEPDEEGRVACYSEFGFIMVPVEQISELGLN